MLRGRLLAALAMSLAPLPLLSTPAQAQLFIGVSVHIGPPALPVYVQPPIPAPNYIWAPGYWSWDDWWGDYYWVPGTWVLAPRPGLLWTPGYWGWNDGAYAFHGGYWGPHVGWYGGISYGFGYTGSGYYGGEWRGGNFFYNRSVNNVGNTRITNVFNRTVINNTTIINNNHVSYSGGPGGVTAQPTPEQRMAMNEPHIAATPQQVAHVQAAQANRSSFASVNRGRPTVLAVAHPRPAPVGPIHPAGMARPAPGGGVPGPGVHSGAHEAPGGVAHEAPGGVAHGAPGGAAEAPGTPRANGHPEKPELARPDQPDRIKGDTRERGAPEASAPRPEERPAPTRPAQHGDDGNFGGGAKEDRAAPKERSYEAEPRPAHPAAEHYDAPPPHHAEEPHYAPPPHHSAPPPEHHAPPPEHHAPPPEHHAPPPHEGGKDEHHHD